MRISLSLFGRRLFGFEVAFEDDRDEGPAAPAFPPFPMQMLMPAGGGEPCTDACCVPQGPAKTPLGFTAPEKP